MCVISAQSDRAVRRLSQCKTASTMQLTGTYRMDNVSKQWQDSCHTSNTYRMRKCFNTFDSDFQNYQGIGTFVSISSVCIEKSLFFFTPSTRIFLKLLVKFSEVRHTTLCFSHRIASVCNDLPNHVLKLVTLLLLNLPLICIFETTAFLVILFVFFSSAIISLLMVPLHSL